MNGKFITTDELRPWPMCSIARLPVYESRIAAQKAADHDFHLLRVLATWHCHACEGWHMWTSTGTDTSGGQITGTDKIPERIQGLINRAIPCKTT